MVASSGRGRRQWVLRWDVVAWGGGGHHVWPSRAGLAWLGLGCGLLFRAGMKRAHREPGRHTPLCVTNQIKIWQLATAAGGRFPVKVCLAGGWRSASCSVCLRLRRRLSTTSFGCQSPHADLPILFLLWAWLPGSFLRWAWLPGSVLSWAAPGRLRHGWF